MKKKSIIVIIALMSLSLLGILTIQALWINNAFKVQKDTFDRNVYEVLNKVVTKLEKTEAAEYLIENIPQVVTQIDSSEVTIIDDVPIPPPPLIPPYSLKKDMNKFHKADSLENQISKLSRELGNRVSKNRNHYSNQHFHRNYDTINVRTRTRVN